MRCPICKLEFDLEASPVKPFCSERCKTIDLGRWLGESYAIPDVPNPEADEIPDDNWAGKQLTDPDELANTEDATDA